MPLRPTRARAALALVATVALSSTLLTSYAADAAPDEPGPDASAPAASTASAARQRADAALATAREAVAGRTQGDVTLALRDLAISRPDLAPADRRAADRLLARPTDPSGDGLIDWAGETEATPVCSDDVCVHYVTTGDDAPSLADTDNGGAGDGRPDYVETVLETVEHVRGLYHDAGYRYPKSDEGAGGTPQFDVYLGDVGADQLYGYCIPDEPETSANEDRYDRFGYCGLDDDFSSAQFGSAHTALENLQVTVAHEYFHATQFAYDAYEDGWLLEATAAWVEDEVYDDVDDNLQYLRTSQLTRPATSLDTYASNGFHYGTWSFFRFLTERYPTKQGALPRLVLDVFKVADGAPGGDDNYSWQAVDRVLRAKGTTGAKMLGAYAVANRRPALRYAEGRANRYPTAPLAGNARVSTTRGTSTSLRLNHLATGTIRLTPRSIGTSYRLQFRLDLQPTSRGSSVLLTSSTPGGRLTTTTVRLDSQGNATTKVPFASSKVAWVEVTLVNGSGRFRCFDRGAYSCQGVPLDQAQPAKLTATAVR